MPYIALRPLAIIAALLASSANAQEFSFVGRKPDLSGDRKLQVAKGVVPGIPVVFDSASSDRITLRPATTHEHSNPDRAVYRFERQKDESILFYELVDPSMLKRLDQQNADDTVSLDGKAYERRVIESFFSGGRTLQNCLSPNVAFRGTITAYVRVGASGEQEQALVLPEGSVAQCILEATATRTYPARTTPFVAKAAINVTE